MEQVRIKSWNRFLVRNLAVTPEVLGSEHQFSFEDSNVSIKLPSIDQVDKGEGYDELVSVSARRVVDNEPSQFYLHKVDVEVLIPIIVSVPSEILTLPPNAYDLFSEKEQKHLNNIAEEHKSIAKKAFEHWIRIVRWVCDDFSIGRDQVKGYHSGWSTYLLDAESSTKIWIQGQMLHLPGYKIIKLEDWQEIQAKLAMGSRPPIYVELKHDAEESIRLGDYRRSLVDMAMACETFLRFAVLQTLPDELNTKLVEYIEEANISQYINKFFIEIADEETNKQFKKLKSDLFSLFDRRNKLLHMGKNDGIDEKLCRKFLQVTQELLKSTKRI